MNSGTNNHFVHLFNDGFISPRLTEWLDWVSGKDESYFVALPMIQRGSVWKPKQIITLWDSLLRGMPIGGLMLSRLDEKDSNGERTKVRKVGGTDLMNVPVGGGAALIDGQQRTLAMLLGWDIGLNQGRTLWIDLADKPGQDNLFRMHLTSKAHPYGYRKADPNAKLSMSERRKARDPQNAEAVQPTKAEQFPWDSHFPVPLHELVKEFVNQKEDVEKWTEAVEVLLSNRPVHHGKKWADFCNEEATAKWDAKGALARLGQALKALFKLKLPLISIADHCFRQEVIQAGDDPALAVLFKRVGTGGTALSNDDYVYSIIKHHYPETFELVESLAKGQGFAQSMGPIDIVMTAVRLVAAARGLTDFESPDKSNFDSLRKDTDFLKAFLGFVKLNRLSDGLKVLSDSLRYNPANTNDPGLPMHGFMLVRRPVLQVLLHWLLQTPDGVETTEASLSCRVKESRDELLRFALYARLALPDISKASAWAFDWLKRNPAEAKGVFPGKDLVAHLIQRSADEQRDVAWPLPSKEDMRKLAHSKPTDPNKPLRGHERFQTDDQNDEKDLRIHMRIFQKWWGNSNRYHHPLLLWLQRAYVEQRIDQNPANVSAADEVPYDYDHICPANHWSDWRGNSKNQDCLLNFLADPKNRGHYHIGNSIGNVRVWFASDNRSDQDAPAATKLKLCSSDGALLNDSAIEGAHATLWQKCSGDGSGSAWTKDRAEAFQQAVESRVLSLYERYFDELGFEAWFPTTTA